MEFTYIRKKIKAFGVLSQCLDTLNELKRTRLYGYYKPTYDLLVMQI